MRKLSRQEKRGRAKVVRRARVVFLWARYPCSSAHRSASPPLSALALPPSLSPTLSLSLPRSLPLTFSTSFAPSPPPSHFFWSRRKVTESWWRFVASDDWTFLRIAQSLLSFLSIPSITPCQRQSEIEIQREQTQRTPAQNKL